MAENCVDFVCRHLCEKPRYMLFRTATFDRPYPHVMVMEEDGAVLNYHPDESAGRLNLVFGYEGVIDSQDHAAPKVWSPGKLVLASWIFAAGVTLWWIKRVFRGS